MSLVQDAKVKSVASKDDKNNVDLSLVIPVLNEVKNLRALTDEIRSSLEPHDISYEILFIDDGSVDGSFELMQKLHAELPQVGAIRFRRTLARQLLLQQALTMLEVIRLSPSMRTDKTIRLTSLS